MSSFSQGIENSVFDFRVYLVGGKVDRTEEKDIKKDDRIEGEWVDSPAVRRVANPKCNEIGEVDPPDYFLIITAGKNGANPSWRFNCLVGEDKTLMGQVDALTGEFIKTSQAGIGR